MGPAAIVCVASAGQLAMRARFLPLDLRTVAITVGAITVTFDPRCDCPESVQGLDAARRAVARVARLSQRAFRPANRAIERVR